MASKKKVRIDGLSAEDIKKIRAALRQVWSWSYPKRLCIARATDKDGWATCESCRVRVPKVYADHINPVGEVGPEFISLLFVASDFLQAICKGCHKAKTKLDRVRACKPRNAS